MKESNIVNSDRAVEPEEDGLRESALRSGARRDRREEKRRKRKGLVITACVAWGLVLVMVLALAVFLRSRKTVPTEGMDGQRLAAESVKREATEDTNVDTRVAEPPKNEFESLYYYEEDKLDRYEAYRALNPDMSAGDVVWRVNACLDKPWYEYDIQVDTYDDPYIIVNKYYTVPDGYRPPDLVSVDGYEMRKETGEAYRALKAAAAEEGMRIRVVSAYRSVDYQRGLYNRYLSSDSRENVDRYSARAGHSEHHTGMALDLFGSVDGLRNFVNTPEGPWVREHCWEYGFIVRYNTDIESITGYEDEPWHIRYVGKEVSRDMKEKGIESFEEYHVKYIEHSPE